MRGGTELQLLRMACSWENEGTENQGSQSQEVILGDKVCSGQLNLVVMIGAWFPWAHFTWTENLSVSGWACLLFIETHIVFRADPLREEKMRRLTKVRVGQHWAASWPRGMDWNLHRSDARAACLSHICCQFERWGMGTEAGPGVSCGMSGTAASLVSCESLQSCSR